MAISAVVLTHNDEETLGRTLESLAWCDELVVVDDQSQDGTVALAQASGARVFSRPVNGDFAQQRNFGLSKACGDWVLFVDSDEVVPPTLAREIQTVIGSLSKISNFTSQNRLPAGQVPHFLAGYFLHRHDILWGRVLKHGETGRVRLLRLARKTAGKWVRPVHEVWQVSGPVGELTNPLLHFPHPNVAQFLDDVNRYSTLNARYLFTQNIRVRWWHIAAYPTAKFFIDYVWYLGFLDGTAGAIMALMMSMHSFLTRAKLWLLWSRRA